MNIKNVLLCCTVLFCVQEASAQQIEIAKYYGNKQAALSLTFDDGLKEQYTLVFPMLKQLGLKASFGIIGSRMDSYKLSSEKQTFTWKQAAEMAQQGQEIASHGWAHKNVTKLKKQELKYEVEHNDSMIRKYVGIKPSTYFYPGNRTSERAIRFCSKNRVTTRTRQISLGSKRTQGWFETWLNDIINKGDWAITMTHGIRIGYDSFGDENRLWRMLEYAKTQEDKLWIAPLKDVGAYTIERENSKIKTKRHKDKVILTINTKLDSTIYNHLLTITSDISPKHVWQNGKPIDIYYAGGRYAFDINPYEGKIDVDY